jgi:hypothetical protein
MKRSFHFTTSMVSRWLELSDPSAKITVNGIRLRRSGPRSAFEVQDKGVAWSWQRGRPSSPEAENTTRNNTVANEIGNIHTREYMYPTQAGVACTLSWNEVLPRVDTIPEIGYPITLMERAKMRGLL